MITIEKEIEKYISDVSSKLLCSKEKKKELIEDIRGAVFDFAEGSGTNNIADIYKHFGTPEELAKVHMSELDPEKAKKIELHNGGGYTAETKDTDASSDTIDPSDTEEN